MVNLIEPFPLASLKPSAGLFVREGRKWFHWQALSFVRKSLSDAHEK